MTVQSLWQWECAVSARAHLILQVLLSLAASPDYKDRRGLTPLYHTVLTGGDTSCCETLLYHHAKLGIRDENGWDETHQVHKCVLDSGVKGTEAPLFQIYFVFQCASSSLLHLPPFIPTILFLWPCNTCELNVQAQEEIKGSHHLMFINICFTTCSLDGCVLTSGATATKITVQNVFGTLK